MYLPYTYVSYTLLAVLQEVVKVPIARLGTYKQMYRSVSTSFDVIFAPEKIYLLKVGVVLNGYVIRSVK